MFSRKIFWEFPRIFQKHSLESFQKFHRIFLSIPWFFLENFPKSFWTFPRTFLNIPKNLLQHFLNFFSAFPGIFLKIFRNHLEHLPERKIHDILRNPQLNFSTNLFSSLIILSFDITGIRSLWNNRSKISRLTDFQNFLFPFILYWVTDALLWAPTLKKFNVYYEVIVYVQKLVDVLGEMTEKIS